MVHTAMTEFTLTWSGCDPAAADAGFWSNECSVGPSPTCCCPSGAPPKFCRFHGRPFLAAPAPEAGYERGAVTEGLAGGGSGCREGWTGSSCTAGRAVLKLWAGVQGPCAAGCKTGPESSGSFVCTK